MIEAWLAAIRDHPKRPPALQRHVLTMLAVRLDWTTGAGFASVRQLADDADASGRTVKYATAWGRSAELLALTRRGHRIDAERSVASEWRLMLPPTQGAAPCTLATQGANGSRPKGQIPPTQGAAGDTHQDLVPSRTRSSARRRARADGASAGAPETGASARPCAYCRSDDHDHCRGAEHCACGACAALAVNGTGP